MSMMLITLRMRTDNGVNSNQLKSFVFFRGIVPTSRKCRIKVTSPIRHPTAASRTRHQLSSYGRRAFCVAGPSVWNSMADSLQDLVIGGNGFRQSLKTFLFAMYWCIRHIRGFTTVRYINQLFAHSLYWLSFFFLSFEIHIHLIMLILVLSIFTSCSIFIGQVSLPCIKQLTHGARLVKDSSCRNALDRSLLSCPRALSVILLTLLIHEHSPKKWLS